MCWVHAGPWKMETHRECLNPTHGLEPSSAQSNALTPTDLQIYKWEKYILVFVNHWNFEVVYRVTILQKKQIYPPWRKTPTSDLHGPQSHVLWRQQTLLPYSYLKGVQRSYHKQKMSPGMIHINWWQNSPIWF